MGKKKQKYYAIVRGFKPGIYEEWYGTGGAEAQIKGFPDALHKSFSTFSEADEWLKKLRNPEQQRGLFDSPGTKEPAEERIRKKSQDAPPKKDSGHANQDARLGLTNPSHVAKKPKQTAGTGPNVIIYTDGGCIKNPGPGGYGAVLIYGKHRKELSGGFRRTTNNRMELMACIVGLKALKYKCSVQLYSDSKYVVNGITKGWARRWRANGWMRNETDRAENPDLWEQLLDVCALHEVKFFWVKGHAGHSENERCDKLAGEACRRGDLPPDVGYENVKRDA
ncbi:ribonuclease HI [Desulfococcaceae bacterium HSG8]|nr:ribonuclease HI [Desulfococcaceae bacterium HSG8]